MAVYWATGFKGWVIVGGGIWLGAGEEGVSIFSNVNFERGTVGTEQRGGVR